MTSDQQRVNQCTCRDTTGTVIQSHAFFGGKITCMICRREIPREEQEEAFRRSYARAWKHENAPLPEGNEAE